ncbi:DUF4041 domain-containing protein [Brucella anthropi]|uniref:DUF4041 domain-containing protein n=1 Tax=Brucella anthropi TaxID=529 RepID=UPI00384F7754
MTPSIALAIVAFFLLLPIVLLYLMFRLHLGKKTATSKLAEITERFKPVLDMDAEVSRLDDEIIERNNQISELRSSYSEKKAIYDRLKSEVAIFDEKLAFAEMGVYEPHFDFTDSEEFKSAILEVRDQQKAMVSEKTAVVCPTEWTVEGSRAKGKTLANRSIRLTLRAFNNECEAAIANVRWNNANAMEKRITNAYTQIDKLNETNTTYIAKQYLELKLKELFLTHEFREKLKQERDEKAEAARLAREEQRLIRDMERAEEDEARYQRLLDKAKADAERAVGPKLEAFNEQIKMLEKDLAEAHAKFERAQAMAEKTRSGYVYIISNIGSFGEDMIKIGLTRRLDPLDRVRELGDASVPFVFDTHAIIYSDDAPTLERALHNEFEPTRVNTQNYRKEFFRASLDDVEAAVKRLAPSAPFFKDIEAQDYRETLARRHQVLLLNEGIQELLPDAI